MLDELCAELTEFHHFCMKRSWQQQQHELITAVTTEKYVDHLRSGPALPICHSRHACLLLLCLLFKGMEQAAEEQNTPASITNQIIGTSISHSNPLSFLLLLC